MKSDLRAEILLSLRDGPRTVGQIATDLHAGSTTVNHALKQLGMDGCLVHERRGDYKLSVVGQIEADLITSRIVLREQAEFWQGHDLSCIPFGLLTSMGRLAGSRLIKNTPSDPLASQTAFIQAVNEAKEIRGISSIIAPFYAEMIISALRRGAEVHLILTREVLRQLSADDLERVATYDNFHLYQIDAAMIGFTVTDKLSSLALHKPSGEYDPQQDLICEGQRAVEWGKELFNWYLAQSSPV